MQVNTRKLSMKERRCILPDVGSNDADALENGKEDGCFKISGSGQTDGHQSSTGPEVVNSLGVTRGACSGHHCGVSAQSTGDALDVRNEVLSLFEVYPSLSTEA
jgi:hypothetical protein